MEADLWPVVIAALVAGLVAGYGIAMPVGAVAAYLVALTARTSLRTGVFAALGVATADGVYALIAVCGGAALAPALRPVTPPLRWGSAVVLIALAACGMMTAIRRHRERRDGAEASGAARAYLSMWGMTMMNPVTVVYFTALVLGRQAAAAAGSADQAVFVVAAFVASASWQLVLAGGGAFLGRVLTGSREAAHHSAGLQRADRRLGRATADSGIVRHAMALGAVTPCQGR
jgi:arginine exporter protein ArgO